MGLTTELFGGKGSGQMAPIDMSWLKHPGSVIKQRGKGAWADYLANINAPSSVDAVRSGMNDQAQNMMIDQIGRDTRGGMASTVMDNYMRGMAGGGASSDIAANALAQRAAEGDRSIAGTRLQYGLQDLNRLGAREDAARQAYGQRYGIAENADQSAMDRYMQGLGMNADIAAKNAANRKPGLFSTFANSYAGSLGQTLGGGGGSSGGGGGGGISPEMIAMMYGG